MFLYKKFPGHFISIALKTEERFCFYYFMCIWLVLVVSRKRFSLQLFSIFWTCLKINRSCFSSYVNHGLSQILIWKLILKEKNKLNNWILREQFNKTSCQMVEVAVHSWPMKQLLWKFFQDSQKNTILN